MARLKYRLWAAVACAGGVLGLAGNSAMAQDAYFALATSDGCWYPCTIDSWDGSQAVVRFMVDGQPRTVPSADVVRAVPRVGDDTWAKWRGDGLYYLATITWISGDQLQVRYEDGTVENTSLSQICALIYPEPQPGQDVFGRWSPDGYWYPAVLQEVRDGSYFVRFVDDGQERWLGRSEVMRKEVTQSESVEANWQNRGGYYPAEVIHRDYDSYRLRYTDGSVETVSRRQLRLDLDRLPERRAD